MYLIYDKMKPEIFFCLFYPKIWPFQNFGVPSTPDSGTAYILLGEGLKFCYFVSLWTEELYVSNLFD